jgi:hypothetical protein
MTNQTPISVASQECFINVYKDIHGFKPRHCVPETEEQFLDDMLILQAEGEVLRAQEEEALKVLDARFMSLISQVTQSGAGDYSTALRWMFDAFVQDNAEQPTAEHFVYKHGIMFTDLGTSVQTDLEVMLSN